MNKTWKFIGSIVIIFLAVYILISVLVIFQYRENEKLLYTLRSIKPGQNISIVREKIGKEMYEIEDTKRMLAIGGLKEPDFCQNKVMYWFYVSKLPCRVIEIYTDKSGKIIFVTWQGL